MLIIILQIIIFSAARLIEAFRDAEAFREPVKDRSLIWHLLKFPQFSLLFVLGYISFPLTKIGTIGIILAILTGYFVFEVALKIFRTKKINSQP